MKNKKKKFSSDSGGESKVKSLGELVIEEGEKIWSGFEQENQPLLMVR